MSRAAVGSDRGHSRRERRRRTLVPFCTLLGLLAVCTPAAADFPFAPQGDPGDYTALYVTDEEPGDVGDDDRGEYFKYSASPDPANVVNNARPTEMGGIRGASLFDFDETREWAWQVSSGRPDVTIAVLDSGIKWNDTSAMIDLRLKTRINRGETPVPRNDGLAKPNEPGEDCSGSGRYDPTKTGLGGYDLNRDGVFNVLDYACDRRVDPDPARGVGPDFPDSHPAKGQPMLDPQDVLIAFSAGSHDGGIAGGQDDDGNGFVDDMVGWDFLDDDNDPFDDVQYGHGTGEAEGSTGEASNGATIGSCPNCTVIHMRVGDSFIADVNRFAAAVIYATDSGALLVQSALGTLNNSSLARDAVDYAYAHGVTSIVSAADEAAQHNNQPYLPKTILVNSVTRRGTDDGAPPGDQSYLAFNGCTNFNAKITLAIPSTSCSSDAVGVGTGLAGVLISAALNAHEEGALAPHPTCRRAVDLDGDGQLDPCVITPNEVRQLLASGTVGGDEMPDDVNFASPNGEPEPACFPFAIPACHSPFGPPGTSLPPATLQAEVSANRPVEPVGSEPVLRSYPARRGHDQFYGYGRVNINRSVRQLLEQPDPPDGFASRVPPEAELESPTWNEQVDPRLSTVAVNGSVWARGRIYSCEVFVAPGHYPNHALASDTPPGDFRAVPAGSGGACDGSDRTAAVDGKLAEIDVAALKAQFPAGTSFTGPEPVPTTANGNGRPNQETRGFVVKVVVSTPAAGGAPAMTGEDQRAAYLLRDQDLLPEFPRAIRPGGETRKYAVPTGDIESSPAFADLDGDNRTELVFGTSDGFVHAMRRDGTELRGWPVRGDVPGFVAGHSGARAYASGAISTDLGGAMLSAAAVVDSNGDGLPEVYIADLEGKVYGWSAKGRRIFTEEANPEFSGKPLSPFDNVRFPDPFDEPEVDADQARFRRTQHGFIASPVLADIDGDDALELVAAAMDRHLYAWETSDRRPRAPGGAEQLEGYPVLVVDPTKVAPGGVAAETHAITFADDAESAQQGAIINTPAVGDIDDDDRTGADETPEIVLGTNEEYHEDLNAGTIGNATLQPLSQSGLLDPGNTRLYALEAAGDRDGDPLLDDSTLRPGWPFKLGIVMTGLLPVVGEGVTGNPVIGPVECPHGDKGPNVGAVANNGPAYILNSDASSCYGESGGEPNALPTETGGGPLQVDRPVLPAVGHPAFGAQPGGVSFFTPAAGVMRALDLVLPEYQPTGQDFLAGWDTSTGQFQPGFPATVNDLQFLTGASIADIGGAAGEEIVAGTASKDLHAFSPAGMPADRARWPKATTDWTVATPLIGSFGTRDTSDGAEKVVVHATRSGYLHAFKTDGDACSPSSWPRFHHDNANSGDYGRDAVPPGRPFAARRKGREIEFRAPGDDLLCGSAARYEVVTSRRPITARNFGRARPAGTAAGQGARRGDPLARGAGTRPLEPKRAGTSQTYVAPASARRYLAIRAVDDQGNVGRPLSVRLGRATSGRNGGERHGDHGDAGTDERVTREGPSTNAGAGDSPGTGSLPFTGLGLAALLTIAGVLLALGGALRRRHAEPPPS